MSNPPFSVDLAHQASLAGFYPQDFNERERKLLQSVKVYVDGGSPGSGTVTSVALSAPNSVFNVTGSPVTTFGTLALSLITQPTNYVWAGPPSGSASPPTFRALVAADIPIGLTNSTHAAWPQVAGTTFVATHNLATQNVIIQVIDAATFATIDMESIVRTTTNTATLTASETPGASGWTVLFQAVS